MNLRAATESGFLMEEEDICQKTSIEYVNFPIPKLGEIDSSLMDKFQEIVTKISKPTIIHCGKGSRAIFCSLLSEAKSTGVPYLEFLNWASGLELEIESDPPTAEFAKSYLL